MRLMSLLNVVAISYTPYTRTLPNLTQIFMDLQFTPLLCLIYLIKGLGPTLLLPMERLRDEYVEVVVLHN